MCFVLPEPDPRLLARESPEGSRAVCEHHQDEEEASQSPARLWEAWRWWAGLQEEWHHHWWVTTGWIVPWWGYNISPPPPHYAPNKNVLALPNFLIQAELPTVTRKKIVFVTKFGREYENTKVHPKSTILASYGTECYRHSFPTVKANTRHLF